jgi:LysR family nitrogen assimilation transcriptional regulator
MELKQLNYFVHVADLGSFSKASAILSVAQPALSRQIRNLETELGTELLYRDGRGVTPTEAGGQLLGHAKTILDQTERARGEIMALKDTPTGSATLGLPPTVCQVLVAPLLRRFKESYPSVSLRVVEGFSGHVKEWLANGRIDVGVLYSAPRARRNLKTQELLVENLCLIGPGDGIAGDEREYPLRKLSEVPLILPSRPHGLRLLVDTAAAHAGVTLQVDLELDALSAIKELVQSGTGWTVLPYAAVYREVELGLMSAQRITSPPLRRTVVLATTGQRPLSSAARALVELIQVQVDELVSSGKWSGSA